MKIIEDIAKKAHGCNENDDCKRCINYEIGCSAILAIRIAQEWISVADEIPPGGVHIWAKNDSSRIPFVALCTADGNMNWHTGKITPITHWRLIEIK
ncbi:MAG: hypothetical protein LBN27_12195 [Prevotellaceae bacterium]|jgi:hypothetical protein|nr:hypothetical protein [Prevotellaceae bacterium]